MAVISETSC